MLITLPILTPLLAAAVALALWKRPRIQLALAIVTSASVLALGAVLLHQVRTHGVQAVALGGWAAPFGITLVADLFASLMVVLGAIVTLAVAVTASVSLDRPRAANGFAPLLLCLLAAVSGAFLSGDLFNLYVWFELMLLSSFVLMTLGGERPQIEGAIKYVTLNLVSSVLFLVSVGLIYAVTGTLNMAHLAQRLDTLDSPALATALASPLFVSFAIKAAVFPVFFWLPASYHTPPPLISALFAGLLTKVGVYAIIRAATLLFDQEREALADVILAVAGLTMVSGVLGAVAQNDIRRILSFHIVSQIGYMLMGLGVALHATGPEMRSVAAAAMAGSVLYIMHHIIVKTNLFLIGGAVVAVRGDSSLSRLGGLVSTNPLLSLLFFVSAMSLAGIPVLSGFWAKLALVRAGLEAQTYVIVVASLAVSALTLLSMLKIWTEGFLRAPPADAPRAAPHPASLATIATLALLSIGIGVGAGPAYDLARDAAEQLLASESYIEAVLGPAQAEEAQP